jgi:hypothetical protein
MMITGNGLELYRWLSAKMALELEIEHGLKSRIFNAAKPRLASELGLSPRCRLATMLPAVLAKIEQVKATVQPGEVTP